MPESVAVCARASWLCATQADRERVLDMEQRLKPLRAALDAAKAAGRNCVRIADDADPARSGLQESPARHREAVVRS